jgi:hypothetical protein
MKYFPIQPVAGQLRIPLSVSSFFSSFPRASPKLPQTAPYYLPASVSGDSLPSETMTDDDITNYEYHNANANMTIVQSSYEGSLPSQEYGAKLLAPLFVGFVFLGAVITALIMYVSYRQEAWKRKQKEQSGNAQEENQHWGGSGNSSEQKNIRAKKSTPRSLSGDQNLENQ